MMMSLLSQYDTKRSHFHVVNYEPYYADFIISNANII